MRKEVLNNKVRIALISSDIDIDYASIFQYDNTINFKRSCNPLIFSDSAIVMRLKVCHLSFFIKRHRLKIQSRCICMCCADVDSFFKTFLTDHCKHDGFSAVVEIHLVPGLQFHASLILFKAFFCCKFNAVVYAKTLGLSIIQKLFIILAVCEHLFLFCWSKAVITISRIVE